MVAISEVVALVKKAGSEVMSYYGEVSSVRLKADRTPLTAADEASHACLAEGLALLEPSIPMVSEEGSQTPWSDRKDWTRFWLVDPLDGTKEFIGGNGEFTVNVALIESGSPVLGVVLAPATGICYYAESGGGAWRQERDGVPGQIAVSGRTIGDPLTVVESRSHPSPAMDSYLSQLNVARRVPAGSSLKFCLVADGTADVYVRLGPTMEWDVAAGHCVAREAGAKVSGLEYNKPELRNGPFTVGCADLPDPALVLEEG